MPDSGARPARRGTNSMTLDDARPPTAWRNSGQSLASGMACQGPLSDQVRDVVGVPARRSQGPLDPEVNAAPCWSAGDALERQTAAVVQQLVNSDVAPPASRPSAGRPSSTRKAKARSSPPARRGANRGSRAPSRRPGGRICSRRAGRTACAAGAAVAARSASCIVVGCCGSATAAGAQTSVTARTVMHGTRQPLRLWFWGRLRHVSVPQPTGRVHLRCPPTETLQSRVVAHAQPTAA